jgi:hypothetical protein
MVLFPLNFAFNLNVLALSSIWTHSRDNLILPFHEHIATFTTFMSISVTYPKLYDVHIYLYKSFIILLVNIAFILDFEFLIRKKYLEFERQPTIRHKII